MSLLGSMFRWRPRKADDSRTEPRSRATSRRGWVDRVSPDVTYALRGLRRTPGFAFTATITLVIGIGANATMIDVLDRLFIRAPVGIRDPNSVVRLWFTSAEPDGGLMPIASYYRYALLRDGLSSQLQLAAYSIQETSYGTGDDSVKVRAALVSSSYFAVLGTRPALGVLAAGGDRDRVAEAHVVLSHAFWMRRYGSDPAAVGRTVRIGPATFAIAGVAEPGFLGAEVEPIDIWLPLGATGAWTLGPQWREWRDGYAFHIFGRVPHAREPAPALEHGAAILQADAASIPNGDRFLRPVTQAITAVGGGAVDMTPWVAGAATLVLLIACANTAILFYVRGLRRGPEMAVRLALGATPGVVLRQLLVEAMVVASVAALGAAVVMAVGRQSLAATFLPDVGVLQAPMDARSLLTVFSVALVAGILCGGAPAVRLLYVPHLWQVAPPVFGERVHRHRLSGMIAAQSALVVPALIGAGLFLASLRALAAVELGFDPSALVLAQTDLQGAGYPQTRSDHLHAQMLERAKRIPQVQRAALGTETPIQHLMSMKLFAPGHGVVQTKQGTGPYVNVVSADYLSVLGVRVVEGRDLSTDDDRRGAAPVVIVSESLARGVWPNTSAVGKTLALGEKGVSSTVVGVAQDTRRPGSRKGGAADFYLPMGRWPDLMGRPFLLVRTRGVRPADIVPLLRNEIRALDRSMPYIQVIPLSQVFDPLVRPWRVGAILFSLLGGLALTVAVVGLYGVVAYVTTLQRREAAIRIALGASPSSVIASVVRRATTAVIVGLLVGTWAARSGMPALAAQLYGVAPQDVTVYSSVLLIVLLTGIVAAYLPARQLRRIDPSMLLRAE
jgi:putative ABC transport system permease protein